MTFSNQQSITCISSSSVPPKPITRGSLGDSGLISLLLEEEELMYSDDDDDDDTFNFTGSSTMSNDSISNSAYELCHTRQRQKKFDNFASKKKESFEDNDQVAQRSRMNRLRGPLFSNEQKQEANVKKSSKTSCDKMNTTPQLLRT